jgi:hypothetical protein
MDNCPATNKNTYVVAFVTWLIERGVFMVIVVSFLPVGHTHNGPDQIAALISKAVRCKDVFTLDDLHSLIRKACYPPPTVAHIDQVADIKRLFNPSLNKQWTGARVLPQSGMCTPAPPTEPSLKDFCDATSALHWRFARDSTGKACVRSKQTCRVDEWSEVSYPWNPNFTNDQGEKPAHRTTDAEPSMLKVAPSHPLPLTRQNELNGHLNQCSSRLSQEALQALRLSVQQMSAPRPPSALHDRMFASELGEVSEEEDDDADDNENAPMRFRDRNAVHTSLSSANESRARGHVLATYVTLNNLLAYKAIYDDTVPSDKVQSFWIGEVTNTHPNLKKVQVRCHNRTSANPRGPYKLYNKSPTHMDVHVNDIYCVLNRPFTKQKMITTHDMRRIENEIESCKENPGNFVAAGDVD